jgi:hypothetical protein
MPNGAMWNAVEQRQARLLAVRHLRSTTGESLRRGGMTDNLAKSPEKMKCA